MTTCAHLNQIKVTELPASIAGCEGVSQDRKPVASRADVHEPREEIGCCDSSPNTHASRHARGDGHTIARSAEPGEDWSWCFVDELAFVVASPVRGGF